jgi:hypothetical protein
MMVAVIVIATLAGGGLRYGALLDAATRTILGIYGPLAPREQPAVLAGQRPFDPDRADWARAQRWGPALALALAPPALLAKTPAATTPEPLAKTAAAPPARWYRQRYVRCGNPRCLVCKDGPAHGPYWYALWRENGRLRSRYVGTERPPAAEPTP